MVSSDKECDSSGDESGPSKDMILLRVGCRKRCRKGGNFKQLKTPVLLAICAAVGVASSTGELSLK